MFITKQLIQMYIDWVIDKSRILSSSFFLTEHKKNTTQTTLWKHMNIRE